MPAEKRFTVHRAPNVATFQLKRFDYNRIFGGKITKQITYPEILNLRPYMSECKGEAINYKLFAVLVHLGTTSNSGHYFCYVRNSNGNWYLMDDSRVSSASLNQVLDQQAYMLFYTRIASSKENRDSPFNTNSILNSSSIYSNNNIKLLINHKPNGLIHKENNNSCKLELTTKKPQANNLPRLICETTTNVNVNKNKLQQNGDQTKNVNINTNRLSILSDIDNKLNNSIKKQDKKSDANNDHSNSILVKKRLVPYDNNSSEEDETNCNKQNNNNNLISKSKESNGLKKQKLDSNNDDKCNGIVNENSNSNGYSLLLKKNQSNLNSKDKVTKILDKEESSDEEECKNEKLLKGITKHLESHIQSNNDKDKKQLLNGFAKFAESIGCLYGSENDLLKQIEEMPKNKIDFSTEMKQQQFSNKNKNSRTPTKTSTSNTPTKSPLNNTPKINNQNDSSQTSSRSLLIKIPIRNENSQLIKYLTNNTVNKISSPISTPVKVNGFLSNNYYQNKQANAAATNQLNNSNSNNTNNNNPPLIRIQSTTDTYFVDQSTCKTSSITSGSSTNSINSTTEWQVIDRDSLKLVKKQKQKHNRILDNSWEVVDRKSLHLTSDDDSDNVDKHLISQSISSFNHKEELTEFERYLKKKLKKIERKDKRRYKQLSTDQDELLSLYLKLKRKFNKKKDKHYSDNEERKRKKHKRHKKDRSIREETPSLSQHHHNSNDQLKRSKSDSNLNNFKKNSKQISPPQKNGNSNGSSSNLSQQFNKTFNNGKKTDVKNELNEMHLNLLGKNGKYYCLQLKLSN